MERSSILTIPSDEYGFDVLAWVLADEEVPNTLRELADIVAESPRFQIEAGVLAIIYRSINNWQSMVDWSGIPNGAYQIEILSLQKWRDQNYHRCVISPLSRFDSWCYQSLKKWAEIAGVILFVLIVLAVFVKLLMYAASVHQWIELSFLLLLIPGWWILTFILSCVFQGLVGLWRKIAWFNRYHILHDRFRDDYPALIVSLRPIP